MATDGVALVDAQAGIMFGVELYVPWDAPGAVVDLQSEGVVDLGSIPDVIGLTGRRPGSEECREMCIVCVLWFRIRGGWIKLFTM